MENLHDDNMPINLIGAVNSEQANDQTVNLWAVALLASEGILYGLSVTAPISPGMSVNVGSGFVIVQGNDGFTRYPILNNATGVLPIDNPSATVGQDRFDLIVAKVERITSTDTNITIDVVKGTVSGSPVDPNLPETSVLYYLPLARVKAKGGQNFISSAEIYTAVLSTNSTPEIIGKVAYIEQDRIEAGRFVEKTGDSFNGILQFTTGVGVLGLPRYTTTQRDLIPSPQAGYKIFNTTTNQSETYNGSQWFGEGITQTQKNVLTNQIQSNYF